MTNLDGILKSRDITLPTKVHLVKWSESHSVVSTLCDSMDYTVHGILQARILEWVVIPFSGGSSQARDQTHSPALQADSLPDEPQGKPKDTGVGSLFFLLHCRQILYQLSYQGSLNFCLVKVMVFLVVMYGCESWTIKKAEHPRIWCFWTVVLEKTLESPLDCKEMQPVHPKGNQS